MTAPYLLGLIVLAALCVRLPFLMHSLDEVDSSNFARALVRFSIRSHAPHPAGQFYYVMLGQAFRLLFRDSITTLSFESALFSSLALIPYFYIVRIVFKRDRTALLAAALTAFSYGYWLTGLRPISDPVGAFFVYATLCALFLGLDSRAWFCAAMGIFAFTLGVKQLSVYFLGPVVLLVNLISLLKHGWKITLSGAVLFAAIYLGWLLPSVANVGDIRDPAAWKWLFAASRAQQVFTYDKESLSTHLSVERAEFHALHDFIFPWGSVGLAVVMLTLAVVGLVPTWRAGLRGRLFLLFAVPSILYYYLVLFIFSKYYVYVVPIYCALAVAGLDSVCRLPWVRRSLTPARALIGAVALLIAVNGAITAPLLGRVNRFRSPSQLAYEYLVRRHGESLADVSVITDDGLLGVCLEYYGQVSGLRQAQTSNDLPAALPLLAPGKPRYYLASSEQKVPVSTFQLIDHFTWDYPLRTILQCYPPQVSAHLYEIKTALPFEYELGADNRFVPALLSQGFYGDGWMSEDVRFILPRDNSPVELVELDGEAPDRLDLHFPLTVSYDVPGGQPGQFLVRAPGRFRAVVPVAQSPFGEITDLHLHPAESGVPVEHDRNIPDDRRLSLHLSRILLSKPQREMFTSADEGWYEAEADSRGTWQWCHGEGKVEVYASRDGTLEVSGKMLSALPGNRTDIVLDGKVVASVDEPNPGDTAQQVLNYPITSGKHTLAFRGLLPGVKPGVGDSRSLSVGVRNLALRFK